MKNQSISEQVIQHVLGVSDQEFAGLSVAKLAQLFQIDRFKLSRQFKNQVEMTLKIFLFKEKMSRAAIMLLSDREIAVKKVAERLGFCTSDYFIRVFRQYYGIGPGRYREYRSGMGERRGEKKDRRQESQAGKVPGDVERRRALTDRRKSGSQFRDWVEELLGREVEAVDGIDGNTRNRCESCYFRLFALDFDDGK